MKYIIIDIIALICAGIFVATVIGITSHLCVVVPDVGKGVICTIFILIGIWGLNSLK